MRSVIDGERQFVRRRIDETRDGLSCLEAKGTAADDGSGVASGEEGLFLEGGIGLGVIFSITRN